MTVLSVAGGAQALESWPNWGPGRGGLQKPAEMLGDGGIIERAQSSGPTLTPIGCMNLDKMPFCCLGPRVPAFEMSVAIGCIKSIILSLSATIFRCVAYFP